MLPILWTDRDDEATDDSCDDTAFEAPFFAPSKSTNKTKTRTATIVDPFFKLDDVCLRYIIENDSISPIFMNRALPEVVRAIGRRFVRVPTREFQRYYFFGYKYILCNCIIMQWCNWSEY